MFCLDLLRGWAFWWEGDGGEIRCCNLTRWTDVITDTTCDNGYAVPPGSGNLPLGSINPCVRVCRARMSMTDDEIHFGLDSSVALQCEGKAGVTQPTSFMQGKLFFCY